MIARGVKIARESSHSLTSVLRSAAARTGASNSTSFAWSRRSADSSIAWASGRCCTVAEAESRWA